MQSLKIHLKTDTILSIVMWTLRSPFKWSCWLFSTAWSTGRRRPAIRKLALKASAWTPSTIIILASCVRWTQRRKTRTSSRSGSMLSWEFLPPFWCAAFWPSNIAACSSFDCSIVLSECLQSHSCSTHPTQNWGTLPRAWFWSSSMTMRSWIRDCKRLKNSARHCSQLTENEETDVVFLLLFSRPT